MFADYFIHSLMACRVRGLCRTDANLCRRKLTRPQHDLFRNEVQPGGMPFAAAPFDAHTIDLMTAALETAWMAARLGVPGMSHDDRAKMECAILISVACGGRDFTRLQQAAFDAVGAIAAKPVDRRQHLRLVGTDRRRR